MDNVKKKMGMKKFLLVLVPFMVLLLGVIIAVTAVMNYHHRIMDNILGQAPIRITPMEGTEDWDADYYGKAGGSREKADAAAEKLAVQAAEEGAVLLKNNGALPLNATAASPVTVNAFGWSFYYPVNGGAGAGAIGSDNLISPEEALAAAGVGINQNLKTHYIDWSKANCTKWGGRENQPARPSVSLGRALAHWDVPELDDPGAAFNASGAASNDTSLVWLGRSGGEGADAPRQMDTLHGAVTFDPNPDKHYLELTNNEERLIDTVAARSEKVIVVLNSPSPMEIGELEDNTNVDAILWVGAPGKKGYHGVANVISGAANPSGKLPDTYAADFLDNPTIVNFSDPNIYASNKTEDIASRYSTHIDYKKNNETRNRHIYYLGYEENIYNGYRWYETAAAENFFSSETAPEGSTDKYYNRNNGVVYPFGYGLSYATFSQKLTKHTYADGVFTFEVQVKNIDGMKGKDVVQLYVEAPYTVGGIEKSKVSLAAFGKTKELEKNAEDTVTLTVNAEDIASYDEATEKAYVLDKGDYTFYLGTVGSVNYGSHSWAYATDDSSYTFAEAQAISKKIVYSEDKDGKRESDAVAATNRFDEDMKYNNLKVGDGSKTMSRANFTATYPTAPTAEDKVMSAGLKASLEGKLFDTKENVNKHNNANDLKPLVGQNHGIMFNTLRGKDYDDPAWEYFVQQLSLDELVVFAGKSGWATEAVTRLGKPVTVENDGPQCLKTASLGTDLGAQYLVAFPCEIVLAATWNQDLLYEIGRAIGEEGLHYGVNGWYAPATNTHRTPFSGRNFEYFSEDPVLAGKLCAREVSGAASKGLYAFVKHFAVNDQESYARNLNAGASLEFSVNENGYELKGNDCILLTWASEQSLREIYLKSFEIVFKEAKTDMKYLDTEGNVHIKKDFRAATAVMTSFNCIGDTWAGGSYALITEVLRSEWGFDGMVLTDSVRTDFMYADQMLRAGGDACLMSVAVDIYDTESATAINALQSAAKNLCYTVAHSNAMNDIPPGAKIGYGLAPWAIGLLIGNILVYGLIIAGGVWIAFRTIDWKKNPENYKQ